MLEGQAKPEILQESWFRKISSWARRGLVADFPNMNFFDA